MTQTEALRLADALEARGFLGTTANDAATELRRLHAENEQIIKYADALSDRCVRDAERIGLLLEVLKGVENRCAPSGYVGQDGQYLKIISATISKVEGEQP